MNWDAIYLNNSLRDWAIAFSLVIGLMLVIRIFKTIILIRLKSWSQRTTSLVDDFAIRLVERAIIPLAYLASIYAGTVYLVFTPRVDQIIKVAFLVAGTFFVLRVISAFIHFFLYRLIRHHENRESKEKQLRGILFIINVIVWILGLVFLLSNLGYNITAVITGLGVGGIAIALASQVVLGDLFSYFVIFFDRPFEIGDAIQVDDKSGTVEYVGIKTTRLRALSGEQLIFSNTNLTNSRIHNHKRMSTRRIQFTLGIAYDTPAEKLKSIAGIIKEIITSTPDLTFDRGHFAGYGDFSLKFDFVYFVQTPDFNIYMDRQESVYFRIFEAFEDQGIEFAYPTQEILLKRPAKNDDVPQKTQTPVISK